MLNIATGLLMGLLIGQEALAQSIMRCNGRLIEAEQSLYEVGQKCGAPDSVERRTTWRLQTVFQQQCQAVMAPSNPVTHGAPGTGRPPPVAVPRQICTTVPFSYSVPVEEEIWYFDDASVPKALHFANGRLAWIEDLWRLRR